MKTEIINILEKEDIIFFNNQIITEVKPPIFDAEIISKSGSRYWFGEDKFGSYKIRQSNHWGLNFKSPKKTVNYLPISSILKNRLYFLKYEKIRENKILEKSRLPFEHEIFCFFNNKKDKNLTINKYKNIEICDSFSFSGGNFCIKYYKYYTK